MVNDQVINDLFHDLRDEAARLGFVAIGVAPATEDRVAAARLDAWLDEGMHGSMEWMENRAHHRRSPQGLWPEARSVISFVPPPAGIIPTPTSTKPMYVSAPATTLSE